MIPEEDRWLINLVQDRYIYLKLTFEQAELIYQYEKDRDFHSKKYFFSDWEGWDYERTAFSQILNEGQFKIYNKYLKRRIESVERDFIEQDQNNLQRINNEEEIISFYTNQFLPDFFNEPFLLSFVQLNDQTPKIQFLKSEYKKFLFESKREILVDHFRYCRSFKPNELKISLLKHRLLYIWPDYLSFKRDMDEPTKAVSDFLESKLTYYPFKTEDFIKKKFGERSEFVKKMIADKYANKPGSIYINVEPVVGVAAIQNTMMTLLLLDKDQYGLVNEHS